ncbi:MAG: hypothetical protein MZV64_62850 [Ignavibacteriales bacterium]|nr:hypothetical protein [Ignavibacteriales bacterium]
MSRDSREHVPGDAVVLSVWVSVADEEGGHGVIFQASRRFPQAIMVSRSEPSGRCSR